MYDLDDGKLNEKQERAIVLLAEGKNYNEVAKEVGVNRSTIYRWKTENALFMVEHNRLRDNLWVASEARLLKARTAAIEEAMALLEHEDPRVRLRAVEILLRREATRITGSMSMRSAMHQVQVNQRG